MNAKLLEKPLAKAFGQPKHPAVTDELHDISCAVQDCLAVRTRLEMRFHSFAQFRGNVILQII